MPDEDYWAPFFHPEGVLDRLPDASGSDSNVVEFGCGYGTFTLPAARRTRGQVTTLDIESAMVQLVAQRAKAEDIGLHHPSVTSGTVPASHTPYSVLASPLCCNNNSC